MNDFKVVLPTTTEEWQRDMELAYNKEIDDFINKETSKYQCREFLIKDEITEIAEQLKVGVDNELQKY